MIGKLKGLIDSIEDNKVIIDVNGVGYVVFISNKTAEFLRQHPEDQPVSLIIETVIKEDAIDLYGFGLEIEKIWFTELTKVQGVGSKMGLKILSYYGIQDIAKALVSADIKAFSAISGIGPKLASRIVTELKESPKKLGVDVGFDVEKAANSASSPKSQIALDALSALENLGYKKADCLKAIDFVILKDEKVTLENLITLSLRNLTKNKF